MSLVDYIKAHPELLESDQGKNACAVTTPYRAQALFLKNSLQEREDVDESIKRKLNGDIGAFDEIVSRVFDTVIVSICKTKGLVNSGGPLLNNKLNVDYLKSRASQRIIVIGKSRTLNPLWRSQFYDKSKAQGTLIEI